LRLGAQRNGTGYEFQLGVGAGVDVDDGVTVGDGDGVGEDDGVGVGVGPGLAVGVALGDGVAEGPGLGEDVGDAVGAATVTGAAGAGRLMGADGAEAGPRHPACEGMTVYITSCCDGGESWHVLSGATTVQIWTTAMLPSTCRLRMYPPTSLPDRNVDGAHDTLTAPWLMAAIGVWPIGITAP
jgi:hypothetical protein